MKELKEWMYGCFNKVDNQYLSYMQCTIGHELPYSLRDRYIVVTGRRHTIHSYWRTLCCHFFAMATATSENKLTTSFLSSDSI